MLAFESEEDPAPEWEPEPWRPPAVCPQCGSTDTRLLTLRHEMSVYTCEVCHVQFETEEPA